MAGQLVTGPYECEFNGLLLGGDTDFCLINHNLPGNAEVVVSDRGRQRAHGERAGTDFLGGRTILLEFQIRASRETVGDRLLELDRAFAEGIGLQTLVVQHPALAGGRKVMIDAQVRQRDIPGDMPAFYGKATATFELRAPSPFWEAFEANTLSSLARSQAIGGLTWPLDGEADPSGVGIDWGEFFPGSFLAVNNGNRDASPTFTIRGPITNPRLENIESGEFLDFTIELAAGQWLEVDTRNATVKLNGTANRYGTLSRGSTFFGVAARSQQTIRFTADAGDGTLSALWRSTW